MSATVLIVDDNEDNVQILITSLLKRGYEVRIARDGSSALASVRQQRPDVILLDVMMPGMDGMQVLDHLKLDPKTASIPVVMVEAADGKAESNDPSRNCRRRSLSCRISLAWRERAAGACATVSLRAGANKGRARGGASVVGRLCLCVAGVEPADPPPS